MRAMRERNASEHGYKRMAPPVTCASDVEPEQVGRNELCGRLVWRRAGADRLQAHCGGARAPDSSRATQGRRHRARDSARPEAAAFRIGRPLAAERGARGRRPRRSRALRERRSGVYLRAAYARGHRVHRTRGDLGRAKGGMLRTTTTSRRRQALGRLFRGDRGSVLLGCRPITDRFSCAARYPVPVRGRRASAHAAGGMPVPTMQARDTHTGLVPRILPRPRAGESSSPTPAWHGALSLVSPSPTSGTLRAQSAAVLRCSRRSTRASAESSKIFAAERGWEGWPTLNRLVFGVIGTSYRAGTGPVTTAPIAPIRGRPLPRRATLRYVNAEARRGCRALRSVMSGTR